MLIENDTEITFRNLTEFVAVPVLLHFLFLLNLFSWLCIAAICDTSFLCCWTGYTFQLYWIGANIV